MYKFKFNETVVIGPTKNNPHWVSGMKFNHGFFDTCIGKIVDANSAFDEENDKKWDVKYRVTIIVPPEKFINSETSIWIDERFLTKLN